MMANSTLIQVGNGTVECLASNIFKGDKIYNPLTTGFSEVSAVLNRFVCFRKMSHNRASSLIPVKFEVGSISGKYPQRTVWVSQNAIVLHPERPSGSSFPRISAVTAASLVGRPGIELDENISEVIFTKIIFSTPGLLSMCGLVLEAPTLSVLTCNHTQIGHPPLHMPQDNQYGSPLQ